MNHILFQLIVRERSTRTGSSMSGGTNYGAIAIDYENNKKTGGSTLPFEKQRKWHDIPFAVLFILQLGFITTQILIHKTKHSGLMDTTTSIEEDEDEVVVDVSILWKFMGITNVVAVVLSTLSLVVMSVFSSLLVEIALFGSLTIVGSMTVYSYFYMNNHWMSILFGVIFVCATVYTICVQRRIPFAAANLRTALMAIRTNMGMVVMAYLWEIVAFGFIWLWMSSSMVVLLNIAPNGDDDDVDSNTTSTSILKYTLYSSLYVVSFYWTQQCINSIQHTIVSSMIGTWWYTPTDANSCWDDGLNAALCHSMTYSFGSICMGSLLVSILQFAKFMIRRLKQYRNLRWLMCCIQCCVNKLLSVMEYFNSWAFTYIGIHGDSYMTSGRNVMTLFEKVGWDHIINDELASVVLFSQKMTIALVTGFVGHWYVTTQEDVFVNLKVTTIEDDAVMGFVAGAAIGYLIAAIMMELVHSAVHAVIVCLAEAPALFHYHHPALAEQLIDAWKDCYPDECADELTSYEEHAVVTC